MSEHERDRNRKRAARAVEKDVVIPKPANMRRRRRLEKDDEKWLLWYFGKGSGVIDPFWYEFTKHQKEMIAALRTAFMTGDDQSLAASRGDGKTTICERMSAKYTVTGVVSFIVLFGATGELAGESLDAIKVAFEENERLAEDYPEVCIPIRALENAPQRAHGQTVSGYRIDNGKPFARQSSKFTWCGREIILPNVPGSPSARAIIATRGLDAAVRGLKKKGRRPDVAIIDDPDTEETARSEDQAAKLEHRIDRAIAGLGGQQRRTSRVMLTTLQSRISASYKYTDPTLKPSWKGRRFRFLIHPPERMDLWDEYVQLREADFEKATDHAGEFYKSRRKQMDAGAVVSNKYRHMPSQLSALQFYFDEVARIGPEAVATEYDNDPPEITGPTESGITASKIQIRLSGYPRREIPPDCTVLSRGIDAQKAGLHWVVKAWRRDASNYVIDYGFHETHGTRYGTDEGVELAIRRAILELMDLHRQNPYAIDGHPVPIGLTLVDSGWQSPAVYQACRQIGLGIYPAKGHGKSHGCASLSFREVVTRTPNRKPGDGWFMQRQPNGLWLVHCDTDRWKSFDHARWLTPEGKPGAAYLYGQIGDEERRHIDKRLPKEAKEHFAFAKHLTAEVEIEDVVRGKLVRAWKVKAGRVQNHYLDASYLADVAAAMQGIRLLGDAKAPQRTRRTRPKQVEEIGAR